MTMTSTTPYATRRHRDAFSGVKSRTLWKKGVSSTRTVAPSTDPSRMPGPPRMTIATIAVDWSKLNSDGDAKPFCRTSIAPAKPAIAAVTLKTVSL